MYEVVCDVGVDACVDEFCLRLAESVAHLRFAADAWGSAPDVLNACYVLKEGRMRPLTQRLLCKLAMQTWVTQIVCSSFTLACVSPNEVFRPSRYPTTCRQ